MLLLPDPVLHQLGEGISREDGGLEVWVQAHKRISVPQEGCIPTRVLGWLIPSSFRTHWDIEGMGHLFSVPPLHVPFLGSCVVTIPVKD